MPATQRCSSIVEDSTTATVKMGDLLELKSAFLPVGISMSPTPTQYYSTEVEWHPGAPTGTLFRWDHRGV